MNQRVANTTEPTWHYVTPNDPRLNLWHAMLQASDGTADPTRTSIESEEICVTPERNTVAPQLETLAAPENHPTSSELFQAVGQRINALVVIQEQAEPAQVRTQAEAFKAQLMAELITSNSWTEGWARVLDDAFPVSISATQLDAGLRLLKMERDYQGAARPLDPEIMQYLMWLQQQGVTLTPKVKILVRALVSTAKPVRLMRRVARSLKQVPDDSRMVWLRRRLTELVRHHDQDPEATVWQRLVDLVSRHDD